MRQQTASHRQTQRYPARCAAAALLVLLLCTVQAAMLLHDSGLHADEKQCQLDPLAVQVGGQAAAASTIGCPIAAAPVASSSAASLDVPPQLRARRPAARAPPSHHQS